MSYYYPASSSSPSSGSSYFSGSRGIHSRGLSSGTFSRPSSVSPQFQNAYTAVYSPSSSSLYSSSSRFNASRGFNDEDDQEFCPALVRQNTMSSTTTSDSESSFSSKFVSPNSSPSINHGTLSQQGSPPVNLNRTRKVIEIVDPTTGMRVSSSTSSQAVLSKH